MEIKHWPTSMILLYKYGNSELNSEPSQISKAKFFANIVNVWKPLTIFTNSSFIYVRVGCEYTIGIKTIN